MIPVAFKTYNSSPKSYKSANLIIFQDQPRFVDAEWRPSWKMVILDFQMANRVNLI